MNFKLTTLNTTQNEQLESGSNNKYFQTYIIAKIGSLNHFNKNLFDSEQSLPLLKKTFGTEHCFTFENKSGMCYEWAFENETNKFFTLIYSERGIDFEIVMDDQAEDLYGSNWIGRLLIFFVEWVYNEMEKHTNDI